MKHDLKIERLGHQVRTVNGRSTGVQDYLFRVAEGFKDCPIAVGIAREHKNATEGKLWGLAEEWLKSRILKGYDPLLQPRAFERLMQIPNVAVDFWKDNGTLPEWI